MTASNPAPQNHLPASNGEHPWSWPRFRWGCIGAASPEMYRIFKILSHGDTFQWHLLYVLYFFAIIGLGGAFAVAWEDDRPIKCIYIGATFPLWLSAWAHINVGG